MAAGGGGYPYRLNLAQGRGREYPYPQTPAGGGGGYPKSQISAERGYRDSHIPAAGGGYPNRQIPPEGIIGGYPDPHTPAGRGGEYPKTKIPAEVGRGYPDPHIQPGGGGRYPNPQISPGGIVGGYHDPQIPGGGYRYPQTHEERVMVERYKNLASSLVVWLNSAIDGIVQNGVPTALMEIKAMLRNIDRFRAEDVPTWYNARTEIFRIYDYLQNCGVILLITDEIAPRQINLLWNRLESALLAQQVILKREIDRLDGLRLLELIEEAAHHLEGRLDNLERVLRGEGREHNAAKSTEGNQRSALDGELKDIENHIANLVNHLLMRGFSDVHPVHQRVLCIGRRAGHLRTVIDNNATLKPPPGPSENQVLMAAQCKQSSDGGKMVETSSALRHVQFYFQWILNKHALLEKAEYGNNMDMVKQALDQHEKDHEEIITLKTEVDKCVTDRKKLTLEEQQPYEEWLSHVQEMYPVLCKLSHQRREWLVSLQEFLHKAADEMVWIEEKQVLLYEFGQRLDEFSIPDEQMYKTLEQEITNRKSQIKSVEDQGCTMIIDKHPATETIEMYISKIESRWTWLNQLLNCLAKHIQDICAYHQFFHEVQSCEQWINQHTEIVNNCMKREKIPFKELEEMKIECQDLQNDLVKYEERVAFHSKTSHDIIPLKRRNHQVTSPVKVYSLCVSEHISLELNEECILQDTSQKSFWVVTNSHEEKVTVPSICMVIPPPNYEAIALADRLKSLLEQLKNLVKTYDRKLTENMVMSTIKFIKTWDLGKFQSLSPASSEVLVRDLNDQAAKLMAEAGHADQTMQLKKDLDECNSKVQKFLKKLSEEVCEERQPEKTKNTAANRGQSPQTDKNKPNFTKSDGAHPVKSLGPASISDKVTTLEMVNRERRLSAKMAKKMESDESSDDSQPNKFNNNLDDPKVDFVVEKISELSLQDNQMPVPREADRTVSPTKGGAVSPTKDGAVAPTTNGAVSPTTDEAVASDTDEAVASDTDGAVASNTDEAVASDTDGAVSPTTDGTVDPATNEAVSPITDEAVVPNTGGTGNNTGGCNEHHPDNMVGTGHHIGGTGYSRRDASLTYGTGQSPDVTNGGRHFQSNTGSSEQLHSGLVGRGLAATGGTIHVQGESNHFKFIDMQPGWVELFQRYGTDVIKDIEKEYNVNIAHGDSGQYHICGEKKDEAETLMKKKVSVKEFKVEEPSACDMLASHDGDLFLRDAEDTCKCIIKIEDKTNHPLQWENKPFYYDGWCQSQSNKRITLVLGRLCDVEARMVVIPSNRCYYPLKDFGFCLKGEKEVLKKCIDKLSVGSQTNKMNLWTTFFNDNTCSLPYSIICHAVLFDQENGEQKEHAKKNLKQVYKHILEKAKAAYLNSMAIPLCDYGGPSVDDQIYAIKKTIKHYLTKSCCQNTRLDEIVLCVAEKKEADLVQKMMEDLLSRQLEGRQLARLVFDVSRKFKGLMRQRKNRIQVKIEYGKLHEMDADVLVNTTSLDLDLKNGKVSKAILDAAGPKLQEECRKHKSIHNLGEFVITGPGQLNTCKLIFHGSLPMWDPTPAKCEQVLKSFVKKCLLDASRLKMKSIAFPSLGTGKLQFPWHQVARAMYESVNEFERENEKTNLEMVMFVIHPKDEMSKEAFIVEEKRQNAIKILKSEKRSVQQCRNNKETLEGVLRSNSKVVKIMVCEGDMSEEPFDCTLIRMEKCEHGDDTNCPTEIVKYYSAAITDSSQLHNKFKIHVRDEEGCLYKVLKHLFDQAMKKKHTVLSFEVNKWFSKMSAGAMVEQFIKALIYDEESLKFLLEVHIFINSASDLTNVESRVNAMNIKRSVIISGLASLTGLEEKKFDYVKLRKIAKKICHYPQPPFEVSIQGFSVESCQEAMSKIKKHVSGSEADSLDDNDKMDDDDDDDDDDITSVFESVSAEVNPGFLTSCSDTDFLGALETKTKVNMLNKNGRVFVKGTIDQILLSEKLMFLPDEQEELKFKDGHFQDEANPADLIFPASSDEYLAIIRTLEIAESGITQMKYNEGCIRITCNKNQISELQGKISSQLSKVRSSHWDEIYLNQGEEITSELPQNDLVMVFYVKEEMKVILFSSSKEQLDLVKHKIMVQLGRLTLTGCSRKQRSLKTSVESDSSLFYSQDSRTILSKNTFLTEKGVIIKVYSMSITGTNVECIVNATDTRLRNSYGVSKAIADVAGKDFKAACDEHIRLHGPLKRDDVIVFLPDSLKCRCIISIAGPAKFKRDGIYMALLDLENIIVESLKVADGRGLKSIAFPSVCAGLAGFEAELCAQQYYRSVNRFVQQTKSPLNLKEIHFVDIKTSMTQIIQATFTKHFSPQTANFFSNSIKESRSFPASVLPLEKDASGHTKSSSIHTAETNTDGMMSSERRIKDGDGMFYYRHEKTTIKLVSDNICDIAADALVSIEDANGSGNGQIAKALLAAAGSRYQDVEHSKVKMAKRSITEVVVTGSGQLKCEFVLHAIAPEWGVETTRKNQSFQKNIEKTMMNIMDAAFEKKVKCIAVPLIGIFTDGKMSEVPLTICCEAMIAGLDMWIQSHSQEYQFKEVILICSNPIASKCFADLLSANRKEDIKGGRSTRGISLTSSEMQSTSDASIASSSNIQSKENCVICMESITDPKVLPKCGHTFCKECIDQQFMYKPACPCCGVVYGKITGSQPNGTMQVFYEKYDLPGFEGCSTIVIFYEFTGGTQKAEHPHPGKPYNGTKRKAYLPNNKRGNLVLKLLREAFNRRLVFTIGTSRTTGLEDTVTWNDIHHKTNRDGGPQKFGYPDPTYLDRVMEELAVKGITEESL